MVVVLSFSLKRLGKIRSFRQKTEVLKYPSVTHHTNVKCLVTKRDQTSFDDIKHRLMINHVVLSDQMVPNMFE